MMMVKRSEIADQVLREIGAAERERSAAEREGNSVQRDKGSVQREAC